MYNEFVPRSTFKTNFRKAKSVVDYSKIGAGLIMRVVRNTENGLGVVSVETTEVAEPGQVLKSAATLFNAATGKSTVKCYVTYHPNYFGSGYKANVISHAAMVVDDGAIEEASHRHVVVSSNSGKWMQTFEVKKILTLKLIVDEILNKEKSQSKDFGVFLVKTVISIGQVEPEKYLKEIKATLFSK